MARTNAVQGNQRRKVECQRHPQSAGAAGCEGNEVIGEAPRQSRAETERDSHEIGSVDHDGARRRRLRQQQVVHPRVALLGQVDVDVLDLGVLVERVRAELAAEPALLVAAERHAPG